MPENDNQSNVKSTSVTFIAELTASASLSLSERIQFATSHMIAAAQSARLAADIEDDYDDSKYSLEMFYTHRGYVTTSIVMAVASVEATINEFLYNLRDGYGNIDHELAEHIQEQQRFHWKVLGKKFISIIEKYELTLWWGGIKIEKGKPPYQDMIQLISLRNGLTHFRPDTISVDPPPEDPFSFEPANLAKVAKFLWYERNLKNNTNPVLSPRGDLHSIFPRRILSYACAKWAVESGINFINHFYSEIGLKSSLEPYANYLELPEIPRKSPSTN